MAARWLRSYIVGLYLVWCEVLQGLPLKCLYHTGDMVPLVHPVWLLVYHPCCLSMYISSSPFRLAWEGLHTALQYWWGWGRLLDFKGLGYLQRFLLRNPRKLLALELMLWLWWDQSSVSWTRERGLDSKQILVGPLIWCMNVHQDSPCLTGQEALYPFIAFNSDL